MQHFKTYILYSKLVVVLTQYRYQGKQKKVRRILKRVSTPLPTSTSVKRRKLDILSAVKADHNYACHQTVEDKLQNTEAKLFQTKRKLIAISRKHKHLRKTLDDLQNMLKDLKQKFSIQDHVHDLLKQAASEIPADLFRRLTKNVSSNMTSREKYPPALRTFALTLHFYSPRAYRQLT
jgi:uncharacterized membrane protein YheB (UPF0754 family)